jgi:hypothetical protein
MTIEEALSKAKENGEPEPLITRIPLDSNLLL